MSGPVELDPRLEQLLGDGPAPEGWSEVAALLRQAADIEPNGAPAPQLLAALVTAATEPEVPAHRVLARRTIGVVAAAAIVVLGAGSAAAAGGNLPDPVQAVVHDVAGAIGLDIPDRPAGSQDGPGHGRSDEAPGRPEVPGQPADPGRSDEAPGRPVDPGRSEDAPGQDPASESGQPEELPADLPVQAEDSGAPEDPGPPETVPSTVPEPAGPPTSVTPPSTGGVDASDDGSERGRSGDRDSSARRND